VCADLEIGAIALIGRKFDAQYLFASDLVFVAPPQQLSSLSSEHAAHDELNSASLTVHRSHEHYWAR